MASTSASWQIEVRISDELKLLVHWPAREASMGNDAMKLHVLNHQNEFVSSGLVELQKRSTVTGNVWIWGELFLPQEIV